MSVVSLNVLNRHSLKDSVCIEQNILNTETGNPGEIKIEYFQNTRLQKYHHNNLLAQDMFLVRVVYPH